MGSTLSLAGIVFMCVCKTISEYLHAHRCPLRLRRHLQVMYGPMADFDKTLHALAVSTVIVFTTHLIPKQPLLYARSIQKAVTC